MLNYPETYIFQRWHGSLIIYAMLVFAALFGTIGNRFLPKLEGIALAIHILGFIVVVVCLAVLSPSKATTSEVFEVWLNNGYSTQALSFMVGLQGITVAWIGADGIVHMAEEIRNASRVVPWCMVLSIGVNGILGFGMILTVLYYGPTGDALQAALDSPTGSPFEAIFAYAAGSVAGGIGLSVIVGFMTGMAVTNAFTAASRELWAFSRDRGVPGSTTLSKVHKQYHLPLWSILVTAFVTLVLAPVNIGSSVAFNGILSLAVAAYLGTFILPISLILWRRIYAPESLPWGPWRLGRYGILINIISLCWVLVIFTFSFFPFQPLPGLTVATMNWSCLAYGALMLFSLAFWFGYGKRTYRGPVRDLSGDMEVVMGH